MGDNSFSKAAGFTSPTEFKPMILKRDAENEPGLPARTVGNFMVYCPASFAKNTIFGDAAPDDRTAAIITAANLEVHGIARNAAEHASEAMSVASPAESLLGGFVYYVPMPQDKPMRLVADGARAFKIITSATSGDLPGVIIGVFALILSVGLRKKAEQAAKSFQKLTHGTPADFDMSIYHGLNRIDEMAARQPMLDKLIEANKRDFLYAQHSTIIDFNAPTRPDSPRFSGKTIRK
jgi:hypothetical protein